MIRTTTTTLCDRCEAECPAEPAPASLAIEALGEAIRYEHLCARCAGVCRDMVRQIGRMPRLRHRTPKPEAPPAAPRKRGPTPNEATPPA